jgi:hyperosmotically inducible periplasmic protein
VQRQRRIAPLPGSASKEDCDMKAIKTAAASAVLISALCAPAFAAGERGAGDKIEDAWIDGSIETAFLFNTHLNNFKIDTDVNDGVVTLSGTVESDIDRDLAEEIAKGVEGVSQVNNQLVVGAVEPEDRDRAEAQSRDFRQWAEDATTTAEVKAKLLANDNTEGLAIDVDTRANVVTLTGKVDSKEEAQLAEQIADNVDGVAEVQNELRIASK